MLSLMMHSHSVIGIIVLLNILFQNKIIESKSTSEKLYIQQNSTTGYNPTINSTDNNEINKTLQFLKQGEERIELTERYKNITLVLGNTGSGKSTFVQWIAGDNDKLIAIEIKKGSGQYIIADGNRISNSTIKSMTIFPELVVNGEKDTGFYDCPGFSDTRNTSIDIAATYFVKKVADHAENIKMVFVVNYPSVRKGVDRKDFVELLRHSTDLIKDIHKYQNSIAIVATKVDNQYIKIGKTFILVPDENVIETIGDFIQEVQHDLVGRLESAIISNKERIFYENSIKFMNVLLLKDGEKYLRIGIFRRPDESGPLSNITLLQEGKKHINKILQENMKFTSKDTDDFGYTISDRSKNDIYAVVKEINDNVWINIGNIVKHIQEYFYSSVQVMRTKIRSFATSTKAVNADQSEARNFVDKFNTGYSIVTNLIQDVKNITTDKLAGKITGSVVALGIDGCEDARLSITNHGKYFEFLQVMSDRIIDTRTWDILLRPVETYLSDSMKNIQYDICDAIGKIDNQINSNITSAVQKIEENYHTKMMSMEIQQLPHEINEWHAFVLKVTRNIKDLHTTRDLARNVMSLISNLDMNSIGMKRNVYSLFNLGKYLEFLQIINDTALDSQSSKWKAPFNKLAKYLDETRKWYIFLDNLFKRLSSYEIQKDKKKYNVANLVDWGQDYKPQGISVTPYNFEQFLENIKALDVTGHNDIENIEASVLRVEELRWVSSLTLNNRANILCQSDKLIIKGDFVQLTDVNMEIRICPKKSIEVFALEKILIDEDFIKIGDTMKLVIIAPRWEIIGKRVINISGSNGKLHDSLMADDGAYKGNSGDHGKPGLPGGSAGSIFGMGAEFYKGDMLTIIANGGNGGPGQNGGNGAFGKNGIFPSKDPDYYYNLYNCNNPTCEDEQRSGFNCDTYAVGGECSEFGCDPRYVYFNIHGTQGLSGGNGGNGGQGGKGGKSGDIKLIALGNESRIFVVNTDGKHGEVGIGGKGAAGGKNGDSVRMLCYETIFRSDWYYENQIDRGFASSGNNGSNGTNGQNIKYPNPAVVITNTMKIINDYKSYLRENSVGLGGRFRKKSLDIFLNLLDNNSYVKNTYDIQGLFDEFQGLEKQFHLLNEEDVLSYYQSLLERISEYAQNPKNDEKSNEHKNTLGYLYTTVLSKIYNLKRNSDSGLIIDVGEYLNLVNENVATLTKLQDKDNKIRVINQYKESYKTYIDKNIEECNKLLQEHITPTIDQINMQMDDKIDLLINETLELQKDAEKDKHKLLEQKRKIGNALAYRWVFSYFQIIGQVATLLGSIGAVAGSAIGAVSTITESLVLDAQTDLGKPISLPLSVIHNMRLVETKIKRSNNRKVGKINQQLDKMSNEINSRLATNISETIDKNAKDIKEILSLDGVDFDIFDKIEDQGNKNIELNKKKEEIELISQKTMTKRTLVSKVNEIVQIGAASIDIYSKHNNDQGKLNVINDAITEAENKIQGLKAYEDKIYSVIGPMLKSIGKDMEAKESNLRTKSQVALDVTKWQIQSYLRDIKLQMRQFTKEFKEEDNLARCVEKLEEAMTTLIDIYNRIQDYQEQQNLANYIAAISSPHANTLHQNIQDNLEILIRSNLILKQYDRAINAVKQWVFPFAGYYLGKIALPSHLQVNTTNIEDLASRVIGHIGNVTLNVEKYKIAIRHHDEYLNYAVFNSHHVSSNPFFVWKNEEYNEVISKLLHGNAIIVTADVTGSAADKDAIKFSLIEIHLTSTNITIQQEINDKLKGFKVSATHLGNSYYRYDDKLYVINSQSVNIEYSFERDSTGIPIQRNGIYDKIKDGNLMLSPYAMWKIQLIKTTNRITFNELTKHKDDVDVELAGKGSFVIRGANIPGLDIENYYKSDVDVFVIDNDMDDQYELHQRGN